MAREHPADAVPQLADRLADDVGAIRIEATEALVEVAGSHSGALDDAAGRLHRPRARRVR